MRLAEDFGAYIAPYMVSYESTPREVHFYVLISPRAYDAYRSKLDELSRYAADLVEAPSGTDVVVSFHKDMDDMRGHTIYDAHRDGVAYEITIKEFINKFPRFGNALMRVIKEYLNSPRVERLIMQRNVSKEDLLNRVLSYPIILGPNETSSYIDQEENAPIFIYFPEKINSRNLAYGFSSLVHEVTHLIDDLLSNLSPSEYYRKLHDLLSPRLLDVEYDKSFLNRIDVRNVLSTLSPQELQELYVRIKRMWGENDPAKREEMYQEFLQWYDRELAAILGIPAEHLMDKIHTLLIDPERYKYSENEFFANVNVVNLLRHLGLNYEQIRNLFSPAKKPLKPDDIPEELYEYFESAGINREQAYERIVNMFDPLNAAMPFDIVWAYATSPTVDEQQLLRGQQRFNFAGNWYGFFKDSY